MPATYLKVPYKSKDEAKSLGALFDGKLRQWFVPEGFELAPFSTWLPTPVEALATSDPAATEPGTSLALPTKGIPLSQLLAGVGAAVAEAYGRGVWVTAELVSVSGSDAGHVYLELSERDSAGRLAARTRATVWASTAARIIPAFEAATGAMLAPGIKLLLLARPVFKAQHGFSLEIEAIDPDYTLGDLEARKREIRRRLQAEGVFGNNRSLAAPWDFSAVLVVAPRQAAGLGDFQQEAVRLERFGACRFVYAFSRFQGEGAATEIVTALRAALSDWTAQGEAPPDAIVIIRGGGAVNDLAWLNDYALARHICDCALPVLTGIGHQRDSTLLDEVAHLSFDTPSKVVAGIEQHIARRAAEAKRHLQSILDQAAGAVQRTRSDVERLDSEVRSRVVSTVADARSNTESVFYSSRLLAFRSLHDAATTTERAYASVRAGATQQLAQAKHETPALMRQVGERSAGSVTAARQGSRAGLASVVEKAHGQVARSREALQAGLRAVEQDARRSVRNARTGSEALIREISGQGPQKTLGRGFAMIQADDGKTIVSAADAQPGAAMKVSFHDGAVNARVVQPKSEDER